MERLQNDEVERKIERNPNLEIKLGFTGISSTSKLTCAGLTVTFKLSFG